MSRNAFQNANKHRPATQYERIPVLGGGRKRMSQWQNICKIDILPEPASARCPGGEQVAIFRRLP